MEHFASLPEGSGAIVGLHSAGGFLYAMTDTHRVFRFDMEKNMVELGIQPPNELMC